jgi:hypothetical protein
MGTMVRNNGSKVTMTLDQARTFDSISVGNCAVILASLNCQCQPYSDVFTFNRWMAQGYHVRRGEHGIRLPLIKAVNSSDPDTGADIVLRRVMGTSVVFCRCQVAKNEENGGK